MKHSWILWVVLGSWACDGTPSSGVYIVDSQAIDSTHDSPIDGALDAAVDWASEMRRPDAGLERHDARPADARPTDAATSDAGRPDAVPPDACAPGPGEICNGLDDDCDGQVDVDDRGPLTIPCFPAPPEHANVGECRLGASVCGGGSFGACEGAVLPQLESCDGLDNDCDGNTDEVAPVSCFPADLPDRGLCRRGWQTCAEGRLGACEGVIEPAAEQCDGLDNDCDGPVDEGLDCGCPDGAHRPCYGGPRETEGMGECRAGRQTCQAARWGACEGQVLAVEERCDGRDEDCNGQVDDVPGQGEPCRVGVGRCAAPGITICGPAGLRCGAVPGVPAPENCDGQDDDCDGRTDEDFDQGEICSVGRGACVAMGRTICDGQAIVCAAQPIDPQRESCNGIDDDCDGATDEALGLGAECARGVGACNRPGHLVCGPGREVACDAEPGLAGEEICNGVDDDCDGWADELLFSPCYTGPEGTAVIGACGPGHTFCREGRFGACEGEILPALETCDGTDEDCDGFADEGFFTGQVCENGVGGCARSGRWICDGAGGVTCDAVPGATAEEHCENTDEDCDGRTDEDFGVGVACFNGVGACSRAGVVACGANDLTWCVGPVGRPQVESCNAIDDDCDELVDEDFYENCAEGLGVCAGWGLLLCEADGARTCDAVTYPAEEEVCNRRDDDCDGLLDEGLDCVRFAVGSGNTCHLAGGRLRCWGNNHRGQLGRGGGGPIGSRPGEMGPALPAIDLGVGRQAVDVSVSGSHICALLDDGAVKCWGDNIFGQLGLGDTNRRGDEPGEMGDALPVVDLGGRAVAVSAGTDHSCALLHDGRLKCWGGNSEGQLGLNDPFSRGGRPGEMGEALPAVILDGWTATAVWAGAQVTCALLNDAVIKCWGRGSDGQLGRGFRDSFGDSEGHMEQLPIIRLGSGRPSARAVRGNSHTCALIHGGTLKCWGRNDQGQLGLGDLEARGDEGGEMPRLPAIEVPANRRVVGFAVGRSHTCVVLDDGTVRCWGDNRYGQLGLGDQQDRGGNPGDMGDALPPVDLGAGRRAVAIETNFADHTCALLDNDRLKCWGNNLYGQLGLGDDENRGDQPGEMGDTLPAVELN